MTPVRWALLFVSVLVLALVIAYLYGRSQCPPPDWWWRLFSRSSNFGCVAD